MVSGHRTICIALRWAGLIALAASIGCAAGSAIPDPDPEPAGGANPDPVTAAIGAMMGSAIPGCTDSPSSTTLSLALNNDTAVISAPNGKLSVNGNPCNSLINGVSAALTTSTTSKIVVNGSSNTDKVIIDLLPGSFGSKIFSSTGGITIDFAGTAGGADEVMVRGSAASETVKFVTSAAMTETYVELNGDKTADLKIMPASGVTLTASMGAGSDLVLGNSTALTGFAGTNNISVIALTSPLIAYGGAGGDTFLGGDGDDFFYGGDGDDTFKSAATDDGSDTFQGDLGSDTVDYSNRMSGVSADIGPATPTIFGTLDLGSDPTLWGNASTITSDYLDIYADGVHVGPVWFTAVAGPSDVVAQVNQACTAAGGACVATLSGANKLAIATTTPVAMMGSIEIMMSTASTLLGVAPSMVTSDADADDGLPGENDDIRPSTENILGGSGNDLLIGDTGKNLLKGGPGDDILEGGATNSTSCANFVVAQADALFGEAGDDTLYAPLTNCSASLSGGAGADTVDFSGRHRALTLSNDAAANDGDSISMEKATIGSDVEVVVGGYGHDVLSGAAAADTLNGGAGNDFLSGGAGDDTLLGGTGSDVFNGGMGFDTVSYANYAASAPVDATLCVTAATTLAAIDSACGSRNDGSSENDQIANVERILGGAGNDRMQAATSANVDTTFEGGAGDDMLSGAGGNDFLWGDADNDQLSGGAGDDMLDGGGGDDTLNGGPGEGDVCINDPADTTPQRRVACEL